MPVYEYHCQNCNTSFAEFSTKIKTGPVTCSCGNMADRKVSSFSFKMGSKKARIKDGFKEGYNPALGTYVKSKKHYERLLKQKGLVEIGNEKPKPDNGRKQREGLSVEDVKEIKTKYNADISDREADKYLLKKDN